MTRLVRKARPHSLVFQPGHPLAKGLLGTFIPEGPRKYHDFVRSRHATLATTKAPTSTICPSGRASHYDGATVSSSSTTQIPVGGLPTQELTVACIARLDSLTASRYGQMLGISNATARDFHWMAGYSTGDDLRLILRIAGTRRDYSSGTGTGFLSGPSQKVVLAVRRADNSIEFFVDGVSVFTSAGHSGSLAMGGIKEDLQIGDLPGGFLATAFYHGGSFLWDRALTATEIQQFTADPWQILRPKPKPPGPPAAGGTPTNVVQTATATLALAPANGTTNAETHATQTATATLTIAKINGSVNAEQATAMGFPPALTLSGLNPAVTFGVSATQGATATLSLSALAGSVNSQTQATQGATATLTLAPLNGTVTFGASATQSATATLALSTLAGAITIDIGVTQSATATLTFATFQASVSSGVPAAALALTYDSPLDTTHILTQGIPTATVTYDPPTATVSLTQGIPVITVVYDPPTATVALTLDINS